MKILITDLKNCATARLEIFTSAIAICWAIAFANPFAQTFNAVPALRPLWEFCPYKIVWCAIFSLIGLSSILGVLFRTAVWRLRAAQAMAIFWSSLTIAFLFGDLGSPGFLIYLCHAVASAHAASSLKQKIKKR